MGGVALLLAACAHNAEGPLEVPLGLPHDQLVGELKQYEYCPPPQHPDAPKETFAHCETPGADFADSWVEVEYDDSMHVTRLLRWERWDDDTRATARWNQLVEARGKKTVASDSAKAAVQSKHDLPPGTRAWQAFKVGDYTVAAVYLLTPRPPENAAVLEEILGTAGDSKK